MQIRTRQGNRAGLVITADGKGVVMHEQDMREQTRKAAKKRKQKMETRLSAGEKKDRKRMATVAAVYTIDTYERAAEDPMAEAGSAVDKKNRPRPEQIRVWASLVKEPEQVLADAFDEACHRDPNHEKHCVALVDGNNTQIDILKRMAKEKGGGAYDRRRYHFPNRPQGSRGPRRSQGRCPGIPYCRRCPGCIEYWHDRPDWLRLEPLFRHGAELVLGQLRRHLGKFVQRCGVSGA